MQRGGGARVGADVSTGGRGSVGAGPGLGWLGLGLGRCRRARIGGRDASAWAARGQQEETDRRLTPTAMGGVADGWARWTQARWQGARMRQAGQARAAGRKARSAMPRAACRCRRAQSPFRRTACRYRGKAGRRWQHLRAMRDFGLLDAKKGLWRQDSRAMHPESPDCARKRMHGARMLPS